MAGGPGLPLPPGTGSRPAGRPGGPATPPRAAVRVPPPAPAGAITQGAAFVAVAAATGAVAAAVHDPSLVGFGVGGLFVGVCFGLGLRLDPLFRALPGWCIAVALTVALGIGWVIVAPGSVGASGVVLPTLLLLVTGLDWSLAARLRTVALLSGLLAVPVVASPNVVALLLGLGWFLAVLVTCWAALADLRAAIPRPRPARPTDGAELTPSSPGELVRLASLAAVGALALALLIGSPSCDPQTTREGSGQAGSGQAGGAGGQGGGSGNPSGGGQAGGGQAGGGQAGGGGSSQAGGGASGGGSGRAGGGASGGRIDPNGSTSGGGGGSGGGTSRGGGGSTGGGGTGGVASDASSPSSLTPLLAGLLLVAALVGLALVLWPRRRRDDGDLEVGPPPWAQTLAARLAAEGAARDRPRASGETVVEHAAALAAGPLPDPRIAELGWLLSAALFSGREPPADRQVWAEAVLDEATTAHPVLDAASPTRRRRRAQPDGAPT